MTVFLARECCFDSSAVVIGIFDAEEKARRACEARAINYFANDDGVIEPGYVYSSWERDHRTLFRHNNKKYYQIITEEPVQ